MVKTASELSRRELDDLCTQYQKQLEGPMQRQQLAINCASDYFSGIPEPERTPELSALQEIFSEVAGDPLWKYLLDDLEIMREEFETPELQNEFWFDFQHIIYVRACLMNLYYPLAQEMATQYGFKLPEEANTFLIQAQPMPNALASSPLLRQTDEGTYVGL
ncbi:hypothetical protein [Hymenobacter cellulosilyticus]|uniref:Uncharacterized protein n=1 Tax=Hymenobacter cellulosilyticus TaxID=2932248 RepID=A0A8T9QAC8_9BACT|nr:hypothetical protein [Hymenobacter cellulosilyticus]UOQ74105.1 hypothetical protein MUN79_09555 [Hymenobacter cellulosilyticus]